MTIEQRNTRAARYSYRVRRRREHKLERSLELLRVGSAAAALAALVVVWWWMFL